MKTVKPEHPGKLLERELKRFRLAKKPTAENLQIARTTLYRVIDGDLDVTVDLALKLEAAFGYSADHWLNLQIEYDLWKARKNVKLTGIQRMVPAHFQTELAMA